MANTKLETSAPSLRILSIVSIEGNWDRAINERRLSLAAAAFWACEADFIIASGTFPPTPDTQTPTQSIKLGERNSTALREAYGIESSRIIPAHALPFDCTYTVIEAFGNACLIGWLMSGLRRQHQTTQVQFKPISSGSHRHRVHALNARACQSLSQFNVDVSVVSQQNSEDTDTPEDRRMEATKLAELQGKDGAVTSGRWSHGIEQRRFDDAVAMREAILRFLNTLLPGRDERKIRTLATTNLLPQRYFILQMLCEMGSQGKLSNQATRKLLQTTRTRFATAFDEEQAERLAHMLN